jgi:diaminohydroxyphosphoribosylaminopyrimidine deaminase/5-amino-6-(5-phosphoribosylamino)uracil reductase
MKIALDLSKKQLGKTGENPSVGCIIVKNNKVIASGVTSDGGRPHGETNALQIAGGEARGSTVYVTLEPCSHYGQTAPCVNALIQAGIKNCVIAIIDPDTRVNWRGAALLQEAGIDTIVGVCEHEAYKVNSDFFKRHNIYGPNKTIHL